jgi:hypothetical protein
MLPYIHSPRTLTQVRIEQKINAYTSQMLHTLVHQSIES